jgi:hypothetical protein
MVMDKLPREPFLYAHAFPEPDPRKPSDLLLADMARLRDLKAGPRLAQLEPYVRAWLDADWPLESMAHYLAAAGLEHAEAQGLLERVAAFRVPAWRAWARRQIIGGLLVIACGGALGFAVLLKWAPPNGLCPIAATGLLLGGAWAVAKGLHVWHRTEPPE